MDLLTYISDMGRRAALAKECGTSPDYLWQVATRWRGRRGSADLAQKIEMASAKLGPEAVTKESIVFGGQG
jgi:hypothetical protein